MSSRDAEFVKYAGNCYLFTKVVFINMLYDLVSKMNGDWEQIREAVIRDPRIGASHTEPFVDRKRGAGGHCFIKDFEAFRALYDTLVKDTIGSTILEAEAQKNIELLISSGKDIELLTGVYGDLGKYMKS